MAHAAVRLVDLEHGEVSREIFVSDDVYEQEQERIFARCWLFVGHESQVPERGDYVVSSMGEESVILVRDHHGRLHVFLNTCRHRGMKVCRYDEGNTSLFTCPYHGWSYGTDGRLAGVPYYAEAYRERLDKSRWGLVEVAQMASYKGSVWATWDSGAPSFLDYLGDMRLSLDLLLDAADGSDGASEVLGGVQKWRVPCNWKFAAENFIGDFYHGAPTHQSANQVGIGPSGQGRRDAVHPRARRLSVSFPQGHGTGLSFEPADLPYQPLFQNAPVISDYYRRAHEERERRRGKGPRLHAGIGTVFPNTSFSGGQPRTIAIWHPRGSRLTEAWRLYLVDRDAPDEVKEALRRYYLRYSGPAGMTEQDDMENWNYATAASKGVIARRYPYNYEMGMGFEGPSQVVPGLVSEGRASEQNQRGFYRRWAQLMEADSWAGVC